MAACCHPNRVNNTDVFQVSERLYEHTLTGHFMNYSHSAVKLRLYFYCLLLSATGLLILNTMSKTTELHLNIIIFTI